MKSLLSVLFIKKSIKIILFDDLVSLKYGDLLLIKSIDYPHVSSYEDCFYKVGIDLEIIEDYIEQNQSLDCHPAKIQYKAVKKSLF